MVTCKECKAENMDNAKFCEKCGAILPAPSMRNRCQKCNQTLDAGDKFCPYCGNPVDDQAQNSESGTNNTSGGEKPAPKKDIKNKVVIICGICGVLAVIVIAIIVAVVSGVFENDGASEAASYDEAEAIEIDETYYVRDKEACVYDSADTDGDITTSLERYSQVYADEMLGNMLHVSTGDCSGWVEKVRLYPIAAPDDYEGEHITENNNYIVVSDNEDGIKVHPSPSKDADTLWKVYEGDEMTIEFVTSDNYGYVNDDGDYGWLNLDYAMQEELYYDPSSYFNCGDTYQLQTNLVVRTGPGRSYDKATDEPMKEGEKAYVYEIETSGGDVWLNVGFTELVNFWICAYDADKHKFYVK